MKPTYRAGARGIAVPGAVDRGVAVPEGGI